MTHKTFRHEFSLMTVMLTITLMAGAAVVAQETERQPGPKATIDDVAWIAGQWKGEAMGGRFEESWNQPSSDTMIGMFKFSKDDKVEFYEFLTIVADGESLLLRLKHFGSDLKGWEEKDKSVEFPLVKLTSTTAEFDGLVFRKIKANEMHIEVVVSKSGSEAKTIKFECRRVATGKK